MAATALQPRFTSAPADEFRGESAAANRHWRHFNLHAA
jgi:hypothetical protein